ncbi:phBC6A51 family helix-turn-helix protein [Pseudobacteroides cellulosolvens]|nr:phBC6A51 family helix-turn-helix protein [Pseudobacteroides cellulosolvens]
MGFEKLPILDDRHLKAIEMIIDGSYKINEIAAACGVERTTLWDWRKKNKTFIAELDRRIQEHKSFLKNSSEKKFENKLDIAINTIINIAESGKNEATKLEAARYIYEVLNGKIPNKLTVTENIEDTDNAGNIIEDIEDWDNTEDTIKD